MPLYEYRCARCGSTSEILVGVAADESSPVCSTCGSSRLQRKLSLVNFSVRGDGRKPAALEQPSCACGGDGSCGESASGHSCGAGCSCGHG